MSIEDGIEIESTRLRMSIENRVSYSYHSGVEDSEEISYAAF